MAHPAQLLLASASPRRSKLLQQIGVHFELLIPDYEEQLQPGETAKTYVQRVALEKAQAGLALAPDKGLPVLGADTAVIVDEHVLGKPTDQQHAAEMLRQLSGRQHCVLSSVAVVTADKQHVAVQQSKVTMRQISENEIAAYWQSGEPKGKAGGYAIQGLGAIFIEHIEGSYSGIMGLPLFETTQLLQTFGINVLSN